MLTTRFTQGDPADGSVGMLQLRGTASIEFCAQLRTALLDALEMVRSLVVDVSLLSEIDVAALQLLCAAGRSAVNREKKMVLAPELSDAFSAALLDAGFTRLPIPNGADGDDKACLWEAPTTGNEVTHA